MTRYKFAQADWKVSASTIFLSCFLFSSFRDQVGFGVMVVLLGLAIGIVTYFCFDKFFLLEVEFKDSYLFFKRGLFRKDLVVDYKTINKITFTYDRFLNLYIYTEGNKIKLPSPGRLAKVEELFHWLHTQNSAIETEIIIPKINVD